jgi:hypothetical protein
VLVLVLSQCFRFSSELSLGLVQGLGLVLEFRLWLCQG